MKTIVKNFKDNMKRYEEERLSLTKFAAVSRTRNRVIKLAVPPQIADKFDGFICEDRYYYKNDFKMTKNEGRVIVVLLSDKGQKVNTTAKVTWVVHFGGVMAIIDHTLDKTEWGIGIDVIQFPPHMVKEAAEKYF